MIVLVLTDICSLNRPNLLLLHSLFAGTLVILEPQIVSLTFALPGSLVHPANRSSHSSGHNRVVV